MYYVITSYGSEALQDVGVSNGGVQITFSNLLQQTHEEGLTVKILHVSSVKYKVVT